MLGWVLLAIFIILTIGIGVSGYFYSKRQEKEFRETSNNQLFSVAALKVKQLVSWRNEQIENVNIISKQSFFLPFVRQLLEYPADLDLKEKVSAWISILQEDEYYQNIFLTNAQGNTWLFVS